MFSSKKAMYKTTTKGLQETTIEFGRVYKPNRVYETLESI